MGIGKRMFSAAVIVLAFSANGARAEANGSPANGNPASDRLQVCEACLNQCPHTSRDFKPCDGGCVRECDRASLIALWRKAQDDLKQCAGKNAQLNFEAWAK